MKGATLTIGADQGDGFLQEILPAQPMAMDFDLTIGFSSKTGLYFGGSLGLEVKLPSHIRIGSIALDGITVSLKPADGKIPLVFGTDLSARLGPLDIVIRNMGAAVIVSFPANRDGNLGPMQMDLGFNPPLGVGVAVSTTGVSGGGFLFFDPQTRNYAGTMQLSLEGGLTVGAQGLIATRMPDGSKGFSLLVIITAEGFKPIPLGLGFTLTGIGGLIAINRTFDEDALRDGHQEPHARQRPVPERIRCATRRNLLSKLDRAFPGARGQHLFGPMVRDRWGTPTLITLDSGSCSSSASALRLLVLGRSGDPAEREKRPGAAEDGRGRHHRFRPGHGVARRGARRFAAAEEVRADRRHGAAAELERRRRASRSPSAACTRVHAAGRISRRSSASRSASAPATTRG